MDFAQTGPLVVLAFQTQLRKQNCALPHTHISDFHVSIKCIFTYPFIVNRSQRLVLGFKTI